MGIWPSGDARRTTTILLTFALQTVQAQPNLPDWGGVWERYEGNGGMFDVTTTTPADGRAGSPGVRQHPPLTAAWEAKYRKTLRRGRRRTSTGPDLALRYPGGVPATARAARCL